MNAQIAREMLNELGSSLESLEAQVGALLGLLKETGIVTDEKFAPYLDQAGKASNVRWRAARLRLEHFLSAAEEPPASEETERQPAQTSSQPNEGQGKDTATSTASTHPSEKDQSREKDETQTDTESATPVSKSESKQENAPSHPRKDEAA